MSSELSEAVNTLFDRGTKCLPVFVGRMNAMKKSLVVVVVIFLLLIPIVIDEYMSKSKKKDAPTLEKSKWILYLLGILYFLMQLQGMLANKFYDIEMIQANKTHFAAVHWLQKYFHAMIAPSF